MGAPGNSRGSSPCWVPPPMPGQRCGQPRPSVQSPFSQEIKKYTTWVVSRAGPRQWPAQGSVAFSVRGIRPLQVQSLRVLGAAGAEALGVPDGLVLWHLGPCQSGRSSPLDSSWASKARAAVAYGCGQALPQQRVGAGPSPAPTSPLPGSPSRRQRCQSSWFCAR